MSRPGCPSSANSALASHTNHNFIGPAGAIIAGFFYFLLGAGSYAVAAALLGYGGAKLLAPGMRIARRLPWIAGAVLSFSCLADLQRFFLADWIADHAHPGQGGLARALASAISFTTLSAPFGSGILLTLLYVTCLVMMTGIHPIALIRRLIALPGIWAENRRKARARTRR